MKPKDFKVSAPMQDNPAAANGHCHRRQQNAEGEEKKDRFPATGDSHVPDRILHSAGKERLRTQGGQERPPTTWL
jgi:hypothetical protein